MNRFARWSLCLGAIFSASAVAADEPKDPKNWTPIQIRGEQKAPEFEAVTEWLNSPALTIKELKGKVVLVHFMAFG